MTGVNLHSRICRKIKAVLIISQGHRWNPQKFGTSDAKCQGGVA